MTEIKKTHFFTEGMWLAFRLAKRSAQQAALPAATRLRII